MPVLAVPAGKIAPIGTDRDNASGGVKMIEGFFFDRIDGNGYSFSEIVGQEAPVFIISRPTYTAPAGFYAAFGGTKTTVNTVIVKDLIM
jgi:hypothetical protein